MAYETSTIDTAAEEARITSILKAANEKNNSLANSDMFQTLFLAELQNQDPTEPMDNAQMMTQLAQTNTMQYLAQMSSSINAMASNSTLSQASSLIGKAVSGLDSSNDSAAVAGIVYSVRMEDGEAYLNLGTKELKASDVIEVTDPSYLSTEETT